MKLGVLRAVALLSIAQASTLINYSEFKYPYPQPFEDPTAPLQYDNENKNVRSDMFYTPAAVWIWTDQLLKWASVYFWTLTPLPTLVFISNWFFYFWDMIAFWGEPEFSDFRPTMYRNFFAYLCMDYQKGSIGILKWYDLFSLRGFLDYQLDALHLFIFPWLSLGLYLVRLMTGDWLWMSIQQLNPVDMNRLFSGPGAAALEQSGMSQGEGQYCNDAYDEKCWKTNPEGKDCNGVKGEGLFCYCPSMGYNCSCKKETGYQGVKDICYDYQWFDCDGQIVDGTDKWCQDPDNKWYHGNKP